jgi:hypothetical protein
VQNRGGNSFARYCGLSLPSDRGLFANCRRQNRRDDGSNVQCRAVDRCEIGIVLVEQQRQVRSPKDDGVEPLPRDEVQGQLAQGMILFLRSLAIQRDTQIGVVDEVDLIGTRLDKSSSGTNPYSRERMTNRVPKIATRRIDRRATS